MSNKKFAKVAVLSVMSILALAGCNSSSDEIYAKPSNYDDPIITIDGNEEKIHNDILSIIYDSMHDGSVASKVLEKVLYRYAESIFGFYNKETAKDEGDVVTLEEAANDPTKIDNFIRAHKAYWLYNEDGEHVDEDGNPVGDNYVPCATEKSNVQSKWDAIETRIAEMMYSKATSGSYVSKHFFKEVEFVKSLWKDNKSVDYKAARDANLKPLLVDYQLEDKDVFDLANGGLLHREYYQNANQNITYIEDVLIPSIYNDLLIEQYLLDEDLSAIRNSRARKINVIKIDKYSSFTNNADALVKHLVEAIYTKNVPTGDHVMTKTSDIEEYYSDLFDTYAIVNKGLYTEIQSDAAAKAIVDDLNKVASDIYEVNNYDVDGDPSTDDDKIYFYNNTAYGDLIKDYEEFLSAKTYDELDMTLYNKFTSSGTVTHEEGLDQATIDIDQKESITKGWFVQGSQPSLDSNGKINELLFKISIANSKLEVGGEDNTDGTDPELIAENLEKLESLDRFVKDGTTWKLRDEPSDKENKYLCSINGAYFLKFEGQYSQSNPFNDIVYDDGSAYYIVNVLEAVKDNKLKASGSTSYGTLRGVSFLNSVIDEISKKVAETGSYASLSKEYWLKKMDIKYHDQKVYDYFKENYPDLFDRSKKQ